MASYSAAEMLGLGLVLKLP